MPLDASAARTIACLLVVLVHVNLYVRPGMAAWWPGAHVSGPLYAIPVPAFLLLSGYHASAPGRVLDGATLGRRVGRIAPPYLTWAAIMLALGVPVRETGWDLVVAVLTGPWQLYYLLSLLHLLALATVLERRLSPRAVLAVLALGSTVVFGAASLALWTTDTAPDEYWLTRFGPTWGLFFGLGALLRREAGWVERLHRQWWIPGLGAAALAPLYLREFLAEEAAFGDVYRQQIVATGLPFQACAALALVGAASRLRDRAPVRALAALAPDTFGIYLCHTTVLVVLYGVLRRHGWTSAGPLEVPLVGAATWLLSTALVRVVRRVLPVRAAALAVG